MGVTLLVALVIAAAMSLAAVVDPFDWFPSFDALWADCSDDLGTGRDDCAYDARFPGFWWHLAANLAWAAAVFGALLFFAGTVAELRRLRTERLASEQAAAEYADALGAATLAGAAVFALGALPIVAAVL